MNTEPTSQPAEDHDIDSIRAAQATESAKLREEARINREAAVKEIREVLRYKLGTDYAVTYKYGKLHVLCDDVFEEGLRAAFEKHNVEVHTWHTYS